jgi:hypothetical protein
MKQPTNSKPRDVKHRQDFMTCEDREAKAYLDALAQEAQEDDAEREMELDPFWEKARRDHD